MRNRRSTTESPTHGSRPTSTSNEETPTMLMAPMRMALRPIRSDSRPNPMAPMAATPNSENKLDT